MLSNFERTAPRKFGSLPDAKTSIACSQSLITGSESIRHISSGFLRSFSAFTPALSIREPGLAWRFAEQSWSTTVAACGLNRNTGKVRPSSLRCRRRKERSVNCRAIEILLVEDNPGDARLTLEAFKEGRVLNHLTVINDGAEALEYLRR